MEVSYYHHPYFKDTDINISDLISNNEIKLIICGIKNEYLINICKEHNIKLISFLDSENYTWENSKLTAEGLLKKIFSDYDDSISDLKILILGYGYCAKAIYKYLHEICKNITIYARDYHDKKELLSRDIKRSNLDDLAKYDIIINTIDFNIITNQMINNIKKDCKIYDIASYPYGFDIDYLKENGYKIDILAKIPSIYTLNKASKIIYDEIMKYIFVC